MTESRFILLARQERLENGEFAVLPEELIARMFCLMIKSAKLDQSNCSDQLCASADPLWGQYPLLIYKHWMIPSKYIFTFFRQATQIDSKTHTLNPELTRQIENLIDAITNRLDLILVSHLTFFTIHYSHAL